MPKLTLSFTDQVEADKIFDPFAEATGYHARIPNPNVGEPGEPAEIDNPISREEHNFAQIRNFLLSRAADRRYQEKLNETRQTGRDEALAEVEASATAAGLVFAVEP
jgi:hypothetical protein